MPNETRKEKLEEDIRRLSHQIDLIEDELYFFRQLNIAEAELEGLEQQGPTSPRRSPRRRNQPTGNTNHITEFPIGTEVKFTLATTEKPHLRGKTAVVVGHTPKFVKVRREEETILRTPIKLRKTSRRNHEREEGETSRTSIQAKEGERRRSNRKGKAKVSQSQS